MSLETRFLCPVKTCKRAFKSKTTWTTHIRTVHPFVEVQSQDLSVITLPPFRNRCNFTPIQVSPPSSPDNHHEYEYYDVESPHPLEDVVEKFSGQFLLLSGVIPR